MKNLGLCLLLLLAISTVAVAQSQTVTLTMDDTPSIGQRRDLKGRDVYRHLPTVQRATFTHSRFSCRQTFSAPYTPKFSSCTSRIFDRNSSSRFARAERSSGSRAQALRA